MANSNVNLKKAKFLSELPLSESDELSSVSERRSFNDGATVFAQGSKLPGVYVVAKGSLRIFRGSGKNRVQILDVIKPGQCVGEVQVFSDGIAATTAEARGATECWIVPALALRQAIMRNPIVAEVMFRHVASKLLHLIPLLERLSTNTVPERVAQLILDQCAEAPEHGNIVEFRDTQDHMAKYIGSSREALNRGLRLLCDLGFMQSTFPVVHIIDMQKLQRYARGLQ